jgi:hypothetical protein
VIRPNAAPNTFLAAIPSVVGALLIIIIGWMSVGVLAGVTTKVLRRAEADRLFAQFSRDVYGPGESGSGRVWSLVSLSSGSSESSSSWRRPTCSG